jgi:hypothetical protein
MELASSHHVHERTAKISSFLAALCERQIQPQPAACCGLPSGGDPAHALPVNNQSAANSLINGFIDARRSGTKESPALFRCVKLI